MKLVACALPLLAGLPSVMAAQVTLSLPRLQRPVVKAALGPVSVVATLGGHGVSVRATPGSRSRSASPRARTPVAASASAARVLATAKRYVGIRYRYGGESPASGFDCSGFVQYVFARHGITVPRSSRLQASAGESVPLPLGSLHPGDLLLFSSRGRGVDHVAIYVGDNRILHSSAGAGGVVYDDLDSPRGKWYLKRHVASRRVL
ncbi:MAG TPA: NlpC/P60 family protein [Gemmatimonadales bacterium]|nr:NlpC/P60 family protein [Gemmatimonadales bacterium]